MRTCNTCGSTSNTCGRDLEVPCLDSCVGCTAEQRSPCKLGCPIGKAFRPAPTPMIGITEFDFDAAFKEDQLLTDLMVENARLKAILHKCAGHVTFMMRIYPHYKVDTRGPRGLCWDIVQEAYPEAFAYLQDHGWDATYDKFFSEDV